MDWGDLGLALGLLGQVVVGHLQIGLVPIHDGDARRVEAYASALYAFFSLGATFSVKDIQFAMRCTSHRRRTCG